MRRVMVNEYLGWWRRKWHREVPTEVLPELPDRAGGTAVDSRLAMWRLLGGLVMSVRLDRQELARVARSMG